MESGTRIGPYEVVDRLGAGGMGEVYRGRDARLGRDVALKVLPESMTDDPASLARLEREARSLAALNHPNIAHVYGLEQADSAVIVMELVEGEELGERIVAGGMPLEEVLPIARQIAEALEAAHARGIVHRDLKPANVKITPDGKVKVLDFGLAKSAEGETRPGADVTQSPTLMMTAATPGLVMGTAAYMSPEQAKGLPVDKRADLWAYGAVLFEMLTGRRLFDGNDLTEVLAAVISTEPDLTRLPASTPRWLRDLIERCLRRDLTMRLPDAGAARIAIVEAGSGATRGEGVPGGRRPGWALAAAALALGLMLGAWLLPGLVAPEVDPPPTLYTELVLDPPPLPDAPISISPDGHRIAYTGGDADRPVMVYVRNLRDGTTTPLPGSEQGYDPVFSPDNASLAFFAGGQLWQGAIGGSLPKVVTPASGGAEGLIWRPDDTLIFATGGYLTLRRVPAAGGTPTELPARFADVQDGLRVSTPFALPDPDYLLVSFLVPGTEVSRVGVLSLVDGELTELARGSDPRFVAPSTLLFVQRGTLVAASFDPGRRALTSPERALELPGVTLVTASLATGDAAVAAVLSTGSGLFPMGVPDSRELVWVDRAGGETPTGFVLEEGRQLTVGANGAIGASLSQDEDRVVLVAQGGPMVVDLDDTDSRITLPRPGTALAYAKWHPSGESVSVLGNQDGAYRGYLIPASGTGQPQLISEIPQSIPLSFFPDGRTMLGYIVTQDSGRDLWVFGLDGTATPLLQTPANERASSVAPDGNAFVYVSDESGEDRVYVRLYPDVGRAWVISGDGASSPIWSRDGSEVFFLEGGRMMAVDVDLSDGVRVGTPQPLFGASAYEQDPFAIPMYDVARDGRFLMVRRGLGVRTWRLIQNWGTALAN